MRWITFAACASVLLTAMGSLSAGTIEVALKDLQVNPCPASNQNKPVISTNDQSNQPSQCFKITGTAVNPADGPAKDVDIFGRITDANGTPAVTRRRVGSVEQIPSGTSPFSLEIFVPQSAKPPLKLENIRASGFSNESRPRR
ncbi:MAG: hypothetical protein H7Y22_06695 [Gemmatimonadaceae bacterium]|nr:hypothetical protein [Gloeobacterales cyanobacterium ES-bin-141]